MPDFFIEKVSIIATDLFEVTSMRHLLSQRQELVITSQLFTAVATLSVSSPDAQYKCILLSHKIEII